MIGLKTTIDIDYIPPDQYPDYAPPNYHAASSVTLCCRTEGTSAWQCQLQMVINM